MPVVRSANRSVAVRLETCAALPAAGADRRRRAGPLGRDVVDVEQAGFQLALEDTDEPAVDRVVKAERLNDEASACRTVTFFKSPMKRR